MIEIRKISIIELEVDAVVNAANDGLWAGSGVCGAIFEAAGYDRLKKACSAIGHCDTGSAVITPGFKMKAKYIIHAVGPVWRGGNDREPQLLYGAYRKSLELAMENNCHSIGFPLLSAGVFGYPKDKAWKEAIQACIDFENINTKYSIDIIFAVLDDEIMMMGQKTLRELKQQKDVSGESVRKDSDSFSKIYIGEQVYGAVYFHLPQEPNGYLSNWYISPFTLGGIKFSSNEQYIMYQKCLIFGDAASAEAILATDNTEEQQQIGRKAKGYIAHVWEGLRQLVAVRGLMGKFSQNDELKKKLLDTGDAYLVECAGSDKIWACGIRLDNDDRFYTDRWNGTNILGFALMEVREELRKQSGQYRYDKEQKSPDVNLKISIDRKLDRIRGSLIGGAAGDALGYPVEFDREKDIVESFGKKGITAYKIDQRTGKALISDDTQMTLFTANGLLVGDTRGKLRGIQAAPRHYVARAYQDWLSTQEISYDEGCTKSDDDLNKNSTWLMDVPELYSRRAPGNTCLDALRNQRRKSENAGIDSYIRLLQNDSKGCGGIMRVAPLAFNYDKYRSIEKLDLEGAEIAAITHSHSLGYMPAAVLTHIISRIIYSSENMSLKDIIKEAEYTISRLFSGDKHLEELINIIDLAIELSENERDDLDNINQIGEGWVAEETLAIAIYCSLKYQNDFSAGIIAAVNHDGDSDSTGAVTGNILGALLGYEAIDERWKKDLELKDVILEIAEDLYSGCQMSEYGDKDDPVWKEKYIRMRWKA